MRGERDQIRSPGRMRLSPGCECLESRQLLSSDSGTVAINALTAQPSVSVIPMVASGPSGYSPEQIQTAYGVNQIKFDSGTIPGTGAGETIAIVDAYNDPTIASDLAKFDAEYDLQTPASFEVKNLGATTTSASWALEESLDVEWAHAIAPAANIVLVEAANSSLNSLFSAVSYASKLAGVGVVSMSWGTEEFFGESNYNSIFTTPAGHTNVTYVASSGDSGAWYGPMYPSVSPNVLAVGGTTLTLSSSGTIESETGWSDSTGGFSGTDTRFWSYESVPSYQVSTQASVGLNYGVRTTPDVSFNANPGTGVSVYDSVSDDGQSGWFEVGGTSAGAPAWAGLIAIADQGLNDSGKGTLSSTQTLSALYSLPSSSFNDITSGNNGYSATTGYDLVTGLGSPKSQLVVAGLLSASGVSSTTTTSTNASTGSTSPGSTTSHHFVLTVASTGLVSSSTTTSNQAVASVAVSAEFLGVVSTQPTTTAASTSTQSTDTASQSTANASTSVSTSTVGQGVASKTVVDPSTPDDDESLIDRTAPAPAAKQSLEVTSPAVQAGDDEAVPAEGDPEAMPTPATPPAPTKLKTPPEKKPAPAMPEPDTSGTLIDAALETIGDDWSPRRARLANEPRVLVDRLADSSVDTSETTLAGTSAALAAGLYWFLKDKKNGRKPARFLPGRN